MGFGFYAIADMIIENNKILSNIILITGFIGCIGGLFVHGLLCIQAIIYKRITDNGKTNFEIADICVVIAVLSGALDVPKYMALLNSIVFLIIGAVFRKINPDKFQDLPGIIMPSLGLAMIGIIGIVAYLA